MYLYLLQYLLTVVNTKSSYLPPVSKYWHKNRWFRISFSVCLFCSNRVNYFFHFNIYYFWIYFRNAFLVVQVCAAGSELKQPVHLLWRVQTSTATLAKLPGGKWKLVPCKSIWNIVATRLRWVFSKNYIYLCIQIKWKKVFMSDSWILKVLYYITSISSITAISLENHYFLQYVTTPCKLLLLFFFL